MKVAAAAGLILGALVALALTVALLFHRIRELERRTPGDEVPEL